MNYNTKDRRERDVRSFLLDVVGDEQALVFLVVAMSLQRRK